MTAALYSLRAGRSVLLLEKENFGGQIADSPKVENFPSVGSISGLDLSANLFDQITSLGAEFELDEVSEIIKEGDEFIVKGNYGEYRAKAVIIATGVKHRHLNIEGEDEFAGKGVSYCAVCDGAFYADKDVTVIGDANSALQYALSLAKTSSHVNVVTLFDKFFADPILVKALMAQTNVTIYHNKNAFRFYGEDALTGVEFEDTQTKEVLNLRTAGAFIAIGQIPDNDRFGNLVDLDRGYIVADETMATKTPGLFTAGDCRVKKIRQEQFAVAPKPEERTRNAGRTPEGKGTGPARQ